MALSQLSLALLNDAQKSAFYIRDAGAIPTEKLIADRDAMYSCPQWRKAKHAGVVLFKIDSLLTERGWKRGL